MGLLYSPMKIFHFKEKIDSLPPGTAKILPPLHIRIKPTNACNHRCRYCAYRLPDLQLGRDMRGRDFIPRAKMLEIIEDLVEMGVKAVTFSGGGEPFCYPYLVEAVKKLSRSEIRFSSLTNGSRLSGELAEIFSHWGTWIRISMDGWNGSSYSRYRGVSEEEFGKVLRNIAGFQRKGGKCRLGISFIVDRENAPHVYPFLRRMKDLGVQSVKISPCIVSNRGKENNAYHQPIFDRVKEETLRARADFADSTFEIHDAYHALDQKFEKEYSWCPYLQILPIIGADLELYSCQDKAYNREAGSLGSIRDQRLKDLWFSDPGRFFQINPAKDCGHHCVANRKNQFILEYLESDHEHLAFV